MLKKGYIMHYPRCLHVWFEISQYIESYLLMRTRLMFLNCIFFIYDRNSYNWRTYRRGSKKLELILHINISVPHGKCIF